MGDDWMRILEGGSEILQSGAGKPGPLSGPRSGIPADAVGNPPPPSRCHGEAWRRRTSAFGPDASGSGITGAHPGFQRRVPPMASMNRAYLAAVLFAACLPGCGAPAPQEQMASNGSRRMTREIQAALLPADALQRLKDGNGR